MRSNRSRCSAVKASSSGAARCEKTPVGRTERGGLESGKQGGKIALFRAETVHARIQLDVDGDSFPRPFAGGLQAADLFRTGNRRRQAVAHGDGFVARLQRRENEDLPRFPRKAQFPPLFGERDGETVRRARTARAPYGRRRARNRPP